LVILHKRIKLLFKTQVCAHIQFGLKGMGGFAFVFESVRGCLSVLQKDGIVRGIESKPEMKLALILKLAPNAAKFRPSKQLKKSQFKS